LTRFQSTRVSVAADGAHASPLERRDAILSTLSWAAATLLGAQDWRAAIFELLLRLGHAADASRAYMYENHPLPNGRIAATVVAEWAAAHTPPRPDADPLRDAGYTGRFARGLGSGKVVNVVVRDLPPAERAAFEAHGVRSLVAVPIFCEDAWWGMLGFDDCRADRQWAQPEIEALQAAAPIVGRAIERGRAEHRLRESEVRFRDLAGLGSDWYWEQDADLRFTYLSLEIESVSGFASETFLGKTRHETQPLDVSEAAWTQHLDDLAQRRPFRNFRFRRIDPQGRSRWYVISGMPVFDAAGRFVGYRGIGRDVTAQVEAEAALRAKEAELAAVHGALRDAIDSQTDAFSLWDADDRLYLWNRRLAEIYPWLADMLRPGVSFAELVRRTIESGGTPPSGEPLEEEVRRVAALHRTCGGMREISLTDGRAVAVREHRTADGGIVRMDSDITDFKRREIALIEARVQAETANQAKSAFIANMSHELRTPLNAIIGFADILGGELFGPLSAKYRDYAGDISRSGAHLLNLINDLLDIAKVEAGKYELRREPTAVAGLVDETCRLLEPRAAAAKMRVVSAVPADLPAWPLDRRAIGQVLLNLLSNAVKFSREGGVATVAAAIGDGELELSVVDDGIGIPASALPRLAQPFEQVENVWTRRREGSGLGLAISKGLIELHGGRLTIESEVGRGTRVTVRLPPG